AEMTVAPLVEAGDRPLAHDAHPRPARDRVLLDEGDDLADPLPLGHGLDVEALRRQRPRSEIDDPDELRASIQHEAEVGAVTLEVERLDFARWLFRLGGSPFCHPLRTFRN